ncbi:MAG TPA: hypothetical protein VLM85_23665 [Polyangiaceae bacterium]|nr:hypothetical protein [Polyangiaceae bacterium]
MLFNLYLFTKVPRKKLFGSIRVLAYGLAVSAGLGALSIRSAVADAESQGMELGRKLSDLSDLVQGANEFRLNGQTVYFSTTTTDDAMKTVLDRFEAHCNNSRAFDAIQWKSLGDIKGQGIPEEQAKGLSRFGVLRKEDPKVGDGMVMCFTGDNGPKDFFVALQSFEKSGDLHDLGDVRYVHVQNRTKVTKQDMAQAGTLVQTMWTEGSFNIHAIIGTPGQDSVGSDFATLPRPINSTRRFTAEAVKTPYAARVYESTSSPQEVLDDYKDQMGKSGWLIIRSPDAKYGDGNDGRWFTRAETGEQAVVSVRRDGNHTMAVVGSLGVADKSPASLTRFP